MVLIVVGIETICEIVMTLRNESSSTELNNYVTLSENEMEIP